MKAAVLHKSECIKLENRPTPKVGPNEVLVQIHAYGVCGTNLHIFDVAFEGKQHGEMFENRVVPKRGLGRNQCRTASLALDRRAAWSTNLRSRDSFSNDPW